MVSFQIIEVFLSIEMNGSIVALRRQYGLNADRCVVEVGIMNENLTNNRLFMRQCAGRSELFLELKRAKLHGKFSYGWVSLPVLP